MSTYKKLKFYFDSELAELIAKKIKIHFPEFDDKGFIQDITLAVNGLELKARVQTIAERIRQYLSGDYRDAV